ncbi:hypothetical protein MTR_8g479360 [Medicago truncatula]|uniref:Uncharacterized protein n=1 Tax=Medicago truncatula TaxID=3880 RepID=A0A072TUI7_MEDTR|nr:hypothetical protein MTR_8g479360 [Medicago truncatula]
MELVILVGGIGKWKILFCNEKSRNLMQNQSFERVSSNGITEYSCCFQFLVKRKNPLSLNFRSAATCVSQLCCPAKLN